MQENNKTKEKETEKDNGDGKMKRDVIRQGAGWGGGNSWSRMYPSQILC